MLSHDSMWDKEKAFFSAATAAPNIIYTPFDHLIKLFYIPLSTSHSCLPSILIAVTTECGKRQKRTGTNLFLWPHLLYSYCVQQQQPQSAVQICPTTLLKKKHKLLMLANKLLLFFELSLTCMSPAFFFSPQSGVLIQDRHEAVDKRKITNPSEQKLKRLLSHSCQAHEPQRTNR